MWLTRLNMYVTILVWWLAKTVLSQRYGWEGLTGVVVFTLGLLVIILGFALVMVVQEARKRRRR